MSIETGMTGDDRMSSATATVYIVDDDPQVCESLSLMVRSAGLAAKAYLSAEAFLDAFRRRAELAASAWCSTCGCRA